MYYGFHSEAVAISGHTIQPHHQDIQSLNQQATQAIFPFSAMSVHAYAHVADRYWLCRSGMSVGRNYGPVLVQRKAMKPLKTTARIAVPGLETTAVLILKLWLQETGTEAELVPTHFDQIPDEVAQGKVDLGLIIHEGQLSFDHLGLQKTWDAGEWWNDSTGGPLPLGVVAIRRDLGISVATEFSQAFEDSIRYALENREEALDYALSIRPMEDREQANRFLSMYVNEDSVSAPADVQKALITLYYAAFNAGLLPKLSTLEII